MSAPVSAVSLAGRCAVAAVAACMAVGPRPGAAQAGVNRVDAVRMRDKVVAIYLAGSAPAAGGRVTRVTEREINSYLTYEAGADIPVGLTEPRLTLVDTRRVAGSAVVDLDAVRIHRRPKSWLDPASYLTGRVSVTLSGTLVTRDGLAWFSLQSATFGGLPVPKFILQEVVSYYSRSPLKPDGISLDDPYPMPARIRRIDLQRGEAQVIQ